MTKVQINSQGKVYAANGKALLVQEGSTPSGTLNITQNGVYDVTNYASADVSVSGGDDGWQTITDITYYMDAEFSLESLHTVKYKILDLKQTGSEESDSYQVIAIPLDENGNVLHEDDDGNYLYFSYDDSVATRSSVYITFAADDGTVLCKNIIRIRRTI